MILVDTRTGRRANHLAAVAVAVAVAVVVVVSAR